MPRQRWTGIPGEWVEVDKSSSGGFHSVIADEMPPTYHPATGEMITSKSKFRDVTRASGCVEMGNEAPKAPSAPRSNEALKRDIAEAMDAGVEYRREAENRAARRIEGLD